MRWVCRTGPRARRMHGFEGGPLGVGGGAVFTPHIDRNPPFVEDDSPQRGVATQTRHRFRRKVVCVLGLDDGPVVWSGSQGLFVDEDRDRRYPAAAALAGDEVDQGGGGESRILGDRFLIPDGEGGHVVFDGVAEGFVAFGVEGAGEPAHAGAMVVPVSELAALSSGECVGESVVTDGGVGVSFHQPTVGLDRQMPGLADQEFGVEPGPLLVIEPSPRPGQHVDVFTGGLTPRQRPGHTRDVGGGADPGRFPSGLVGADLPRPPQRVGRRSSVARSSQLVAAGPYPHREPVQATLRDPHRVEHPTQFRFRPTRPHRPAATTPAARPKRPTRSSGTSGVSGIATSNRRSGDHAEACGHETLNRGDCTQYIERTFATQPGLKKMQR